MNKIYHLVWHGVLNAWVAVSELARTRGKQCTKTLMTASLLASALTPISAFAVQSITGAGVSTPILDNCAFSSAFLGQACVGVATGAEATIAAGTTATINTDPLSSGVARQAAALYVGSKVAGDPTSSLSINTRSTTNQLRLSGIYIDNTPTSSMSTLGNVDISLEASSSWISSLSGIGVKGGGVIGSGLTIEGNLNVNLLAGGYEDVTKTNSNGLRLEGSNLIVKGDTTLNISSELTNGIFLNYATGTQADNNTNFNNLTINSAGTEASIWVGSGTTGGAFVTQGNAVINNTGTAHGIELAGASNMTMDFNNLTISTGGGTLFGLRVKMA